MKEAVVAISLVFAAVSWSVAGEGPSMKRGEELFNSSQLGTNGKSCADCHPDGKQLQEAAGYKDDKLAGIINRCIKGPLKGKPLAADSTDLKSLTMYVRSVAKP